MPAAVLSVLWPAGGGAAVPALPVGGDAVAQGCHLQPLLVAGGSFSQLGPAELVGVGVGSRGCLGGAGCLSELQHTTKVGWPGLSKGAAMVLSLWTAEGDSAHPCALSCHPWLACPSSWAGASQRHCRCLTPLRPPQARPHLGCSMPAHAGTRPTLIPHLPRIAAALPPGQLTDR